MELNGIQNLIIIKDELKQSIENLKDDSPNGLVKQQALKELQDLSQQIDYMHTYMLSIAVSHNTNNFKGSIPFWHEVKAKVDKNALD